MLTKQKLDQYRKLANDYPQGNIAELVAHIDETEKTFIDITNDLTKLHYSFISVYPRSAFANMIFQVLTKCKRLLQEKGWEKQD